MSPGLPASPGGPPLDSAPPPPAPAVCCRLQPNAVPHEHLHTHTQVCVHASFLKSLVYFIPLIARLHYLSSPISCHPPRLLEAPACCSLVLLACPTRSSSLSSSMLPSTSHHPSNAPTPIFLILCLFSQWSHVLNPHLCC